MIPNVYRFEIDDEKFARVKGSLRKTLQTAHIKFGSFSSYFPILRFIVKEIIGYKSFIKGHKELWDFIEVSRLYGSIINNVSLYSLMNRYLLIIDDNDKRIISSFFRKKCNIIKRH